MQALKLPLLCCRAGRAPNQHNEGDSAPPTYEPWRNATHMLLYLAFEKAHLSGEQRDFFLTVLRSPLFRVEDVPRNVAELQKAR